MKPPPFTARQEARDYGLGPDYTAGSRVKISSQLDYEQGIKK